MSARKKLNQSRLRWLRRVIASPAHGRAFDRGKITPSSISLASIDGDSVDKVLPSGAAGAAASASRLHDATDHPPSGFVSLRTPPPLTSTGRWPHGVRGHRARRTHPCKAKSQELHEIAREKFH